MAIAVVLAVVLVLATAGAHYLTLRWLSGRMARIAMRPGRRVLSIDFGVLAAHVAEIVLYAAGYAVSVRSLGPAVFGGLLVEGPWTSSISLSRHVRRWGFVMCS